jgi:fatty acid desaturase
MTAVAGDWVRDARTALFDSKTDFFQHKPLTYWSDFLVSVVIAYAAATTFLLSPIFSWPQIIAFPIAVFWLYRLGSLVHEVAHLPQNEMRVFKIAWNLVVGVPTLTPSPFFTAHHRDHHSQRMYGTPEDPEYIVNVCKPGSWPNIIAYVGLVLLFPLVVFVRFLLAPLTFLHPKIREWTLTQASSLTMNWLYERRLTPLDRKTITAMELLCWIRATLIPMMVVAGLAPWTRIPLLYCLGVSVLMLNQMRLLADHHFEANGKKLNFSEHILDSCNYTGRDFLTWLFFPFAIRYHALHHLFPSLPYHNLSTAHAHLMQSLPAESPYRTLDQPGWWSVAANIFRRRTPHAQANELMRKPRSAQVSNRARRRSPDLAVTSDRRSP